MLDIARECSPFLDRLIGRHPDWFASLKDSGALDSVGPPQADHLQVAVAEQGLDSGLRRFRNFEMMRIIWRELNGFATLEQTMGDLSRLAEVSLSCAVDAHMDTLVRRYGMPCNEGGEEQQLVVLGLGKLGGRELNLSSDVDLVFCFPGTGECDGRGKLSNGEFFIRLVRAIIGSLSDVTEDGFCFRVDTRLRPFGEAGPLACSFGAMEQYYQREGRDWERYALIKARPVAGNIQQGEALMGELGPFIYRRYIDYGAVEALQEMHGWVLEDAARHDRNRDIKRGPGGIREIEFLVQCFQLLRGGREPSLQLQGLLPALTQLEQLSVLKGDTVRALGEDYAFLRRLENAIQALHDQQTHTVPEGEDLARVSRVLGHGDSSGLLRRLQDTRNRVSASLSACFPGPASGGRPGWAEQKWHGLRSGEELADGKPFVDFLGRLKRQSLSRRASVRLDQFMPLLIQRLEQTRLDLAVEDHVLELVLAISRRSAYLSLLVQNPPALDRMLELFASSDWIADTVVRYPALLDELIDPMLGRELPARAEMDETAARILVQNQDAEAALLALNYMKLTFSLRVAVAELESTLSSEQAESALTELAECIIDSCLQLALSGVRELHGRLAGEGIAVIAYGSFGARELSYLSDLDLIFLFEGGLAESDGPSPLTPEQYYSRTVRRLLGLLTAATAGGRLYEVDTRLRPNGKAGLLVSTLSAFERYQSIHAWVWELQALTRARWVAGNPRAGDAFSEIRSKVLGLERDEQTLKGEIRAMRRKMRNELASGDRFKHDKGGLVDIDFIAQLGVLIVSRAHPGVIRDTGTRGQLHALADSGWLSHDQYDVLRSTHTALTHARHLSTLARTKPANPPDTGKSWEICRPFLE